MKIRCAWCQPPRIIGEKEPLDDTSITDGICDECSAKHFPQVHGELMRWQCRQCGKFVGAPFPAEPIINARRSVCPHCNDITWKDPVKEKIDEENP